MAQNAQTFLPKRFDGIAIDLIFVVFNFFLYRFFNEKFGKLFNLSFGNDEWAMRVLSVIMLVVLAMRFAGLFLKRYPLQVRLSKSGDAAITKWFMIFNIPVMVLTAAFAVMAMTIFLKDSGFGEWGNKGIGLVNLVPPLALFAAIVLEAVLIFRLSRPLEPFEKQRMDNGSALYKPAAELFADFCLFAYMLVWQVFYFQTVSIFAEGMAKSVSFFVLSLVFSLIVFAMFYLAPRSVFLVEDWTYKGTWISIGLVFLSSLFAGNSGF
jgi:hypothetical protein